MHNVSRPKSLLLVAVACLLSFTVGCKTIPDEKPSAHRFRLAPEPAERELVGTPEWGVALSGGGIRSSLFAIGGMKALYDSGRLRDIKIVSSVSGGSYAAYWLYSNNQAQFSSKEKNRGFGWYSLDDENFTVRVAELSLTSNFVTNAQYAGALLKGVISFSPRGRAVDLYDEQLKITYGALDETDAQIPDLLPAIQEGQCPYLVVNATITNPKSKLGWADGLLEMTPLFAGNEKYSYRPWTSESIIFRRAVAISGSAFTPLLKQNLSLPGSEFPEDVTGTDGGKSENLGAIALIRRGIRNIIIFDAEFDQKYQYGAYTNLKARLKNWGLDLTVKEFDDHIEANFSADTAVPVYAKAVHIGTVTEIGRTEVRSTIYYVKMALSDPVVAKLRASDQDTAAATYINDFQTKLSNQQKPETLSRPWTWGQEPWEPERVRSLRPPSVERWLARVALNYSEFLNDPEHPSGYLDGKYLFPMYGTPDQSFYGDQAIAFLGLGYLASLEIKQHESVRNGDR